MKKNFFKFFVAFCILLFFSSSYVPRSYAIKTGDTCDKDETCKPINNICRKIKPGQDVHLCLPPGNPGEACDNSADCASDSSGKKLTCRIVEILGDNFRVCAQPAKPSEKCDDDSDCAPDSNGTKIVCRTTDVSDGKKICAPPGKLGEKCDNSTFCNQGNPPNTPEMECKELSFLGKRCSLVTPLDTEGDKPLPTPPEPPCAGNLKADKVCNSFFTGFGKIGTQPGQFISSVFAVLLAASGAIALLLIIRAGYRIMVSEGNPEKVKEGRDQLIAAIVGLLFLIFAFVFLQLIGVDILKIPGFGGEPVPSKPILIPKDGACQIPDNNPGYTGQGDCEKGLSCEIDPSTCFDRGCQGTCK